MLTNILKLIFFGLTAWCPSGWDISPNKSKCLKLVGKFQSWDESETHCKNYGGHLAALTSSQELDFVHKLCGQTVNGCWVGGRGTNSTVGFNWKWSDNASNWNESIFARELSPSNCSHWLCHSNTSVDSCTLVNGTAYVVAERCNSSHAFICMLDIGMPLPNSSGLDCYSLQLYISMHIFG